MKPLVRLLLLFSIKTNAQRVQITRPFGFPFGSLISSTPTSTLIATSSTSNTVTSTSNSSSTPSTNIYNWQETSSVQVASVTSPLVTTVVTIVGLSSSTSSPQPTPSTPTSSSTTSSSEKSPLIGIIVGVVVGAIVLVLLLFLYIRRRINHRRAQELNENSNPKPFLLLPNPTLNLTSVPSFIPQLFSSKFSRRRESANALTTASGSGSSRPTSSPVSGVRIDPINSAIQNKKTIHALQPSTTAQGGDPEFLQHARSGVRMPHAEGNLDELPPAYTIS